MAILTDFALLTFDAFYVLFALTCFFEIDAKWHNADNMLG